MKRSIPAATEKQRRRFQLMQEFGCLACYLDGRPGRHGDVHHLLSGGRAISNDATICLCVWHHRGYEPGVLDEVAEAALGPSLAKNSRLFRIRYGSDAELLQLQNELVAAVEATFVS